MLTLRRIRRALSFAALAGVLPVAPAWAQRDLTEIPKPDPVAELAAMQVAEGFEVNLFASDPDFAKPIHMNFDAEGRLWIASSRNYPQIEPGAKPTDQVVVLEDTNGDGRADKRTVFADNLFIPTGVLPGDGGVYVANSTELIHLSDTDGDGRADKRRTILSGFGTEDTHHLLHTLRWGPDGRMYMNQSIYIHSHLETPQGVKRLDGGGIWRFDPRNYDLDIFCKGFVNPWGHVVNRFGQSLATDGAYSEGINYVFPRSVFFSSPGAERWLSGLNPGSPKHCSLEEITGGAMPDQSQGWLVTNDFRAHRVCLFQIERQGSGYRSVQLPELIRSKHIAFRPIDVKMGPDGAIYIADWYNPIIQHGEVDFRDARRDTEHGRIWRVTAKGKSPLTRPRYAEMTPDQLCGLLLDSAEWVRQYARMELATRAAAERQAAVQRFVQAATSDSERSLRQLEQFWVALCAREVPAGLIDQLRQSADPRVRAAALRHTGYLHRQLPEARQWLTGALTDADDQVVLEAVLGLDEIGDLPALEQILKVAERPRQDQFLRFALWNAARRGEAVWTEALQQGTLAGRDDPAVLRLLADASSGGTIAGPLLAQLRAADPQAAATRQVVELVAERAAPDAMSGLVEWITTAPAIADPALRRDFLEIVRRVSQARNAGPDRAGQLITQALQDSQALAGDAAAVQGYRAALVELAGQWQVKDAIGWITGWLDSPAVAADPALLRRGLPALARMNDEAARRYVTQRAAAGANSPETAAAALAALGWIDPDAAAKQTLVLLAGLDAAHLEAGQFAVTALLARKPGLEALSKALPGASELEWTPDGARTLLASLRNTQGVDPGLVEAASQATRLETLAWKWSDAWAQQMLDLAVKQGDPARGEAIYRQARLQCVRCHAIGPSGGAIGPNLVSLGGSSTPEYILQSLIDPAAKVKEGFQTLAVLMDDGRVISGLQKARSERQLQLVLADGTEQTLSMDAIETIKEGQSLMPAGLVDSLTEQELADLTRFLMALSRDPDYTVDTAQRVRNWQALQWTQPANHLLNRTSLDSAAGTAPELVWAPLTSTVAGKLPLAELPVFQPHRELPAHAFAAFEVDCKQAGRLRLRLTPGSEAVSVWLDGRPHPAAAAEEGFTLPAGMHRFVLGFKVQAAGPTGSCELLTDQPGDAVVELKALR
jgi:putative heme-binding domain-containing protein